MQTGSGLRKRSLLDVSRGQFDARPLNRNQSASGLFVSCPRPEVAWVYM
jgi:hypothetical protein